MSLGPTNPIRPRWIVSPEDVHLLQYTGGTTGVPKGAMLTHRNVLSQTVIWNAWFHTGDIAEIRDFCEEHMGAPKKPRILEIVAEMPMTAAGKVDRKALR